MRKIAHPPTESQCIRIQVIDAWEALGYRGIGREEHSGEPAIAGGELPDLFAELADNERAQIVPTPRQNRRLRT